MNELITTADKELTMSSREIAELTNKRHPDVKRDISTMLEQLKIDASKFAHIYLDTLNREQTEYLLSKIYIECLLMGYSAELRMRVLRRLHELEAGQTITPVKALNDPAIMRSLLLNYSEKVLNLEHQVSEMKPQTEAFKRISFADGNMCITDAAKTLQIQPKRLFAYLNENLWIYRRSGNKNWVAYQDRIQTGLLIHKVTTITTSDGEEKVQQQALVTPRGLARLSEHFSQVEAA